MNATGDEEPSWLEQARSGWLNQGDRRPSFALEPGPGQESVWDYTRLPALMVDHRLVLVGDPEHPLVSTDRSLRVRETASPPTFYFAAQDVKTERLVAAGGSSFCDGHLSFYPGRVRCEVDGEVVRPQAGGFYGGWITHEVVGPFKGDPGTSGW